MSANLLEKVTPGPMHYAGQGILTTLDGEDEIALGLLYDDSPDGQLHALAYDHALWGAAVATGRAKWQPKMQNVALLSIKPPQPSDVSDEDYADAGGRGWRPQILRAFPTTLDAFGCPALTPELRDALKKALGLVVA